MRLPAVPRGAGPLLALLTLAAAGAAAAAGYALTAPDRYRATAQLIVTPVSADDPTYTGIDVLRDSGGRRTAAASAAALVESPLVADAVRALLGLQRSRDDLLDALDAHVVDSSDVVAVTVEDTSANGAAQLANAFADTVVNQRTASFQSEVAAAVRRYAHLVDATPKAERATPAAVDLERRLAALRVVAGQPDPTLKHAGQATAPSDPVSPDAWRLTGIGAALGGALGLLVALALLLARRPWVAAPPPEYDRSVSERALEKLVTRLERRLAARESALAARERDLQAVLDELRRSQKSAEAGAGELAEREQALEERVAAVTKRELELARRAAALAAREKEPEPEPAPAAAREPAELRAEAAPPEPRRDGEYNLNALERLVAERRDAFPDRLEEWESYLFFLREHASSDGSLPASVDWLIQETFSEILV
jgi:capsular polysaccharide biosynthesis protein